MDSAAGNWRTLLCTPRNLTEMLTTATRIILKYGNRRLYDTTAHRYITLKDLRELVLRDVSFVIRNKSSGADLTRATLLSLLIECETSKREPVLDLDFILGIIRAQTCSPGSDLRHLIDTFGSDALVKRV
jgi:polyhydroxyalkanoate synthesis repressor PhaR